MNHRLRMFLAIPALLLAVSGAVMLLWNAVLPGILSAPEISFWQALGLLALCRILFGGIGLHGFGLVGSMHRGLHNHWHGLSPDQRREFMERRGFGRGRGGLHERFHDHLNEQIRGHYHHEEAGDSEPGHGGNRHEHRRDCEQAGARRNSKNSGVDSNTDAGSAEDK